MSIPDFDYKEKRFEQDIEDYLTTKGGYEIRPIKFFTRKIYGLPIRKRSTSVLINHKS